MWVSSLLDSFLLDALRAWSMDVPREVSMTAVSVAGQAAYTLPAGVVEVVRVEHPDGVFRQPGPGHSGELEPGAQLAPAGSMVIPPGRLWYEVWAGELVLTPAPDVAGQTIRIRYVGAYTEPSADVSVLDVATRDEDAIVAHVCAHAMEWISADEAKRMRFERERGASPAESRRIFDERYRAARSRRLAGVRARRLVPRGLG